MLPFQRSLKTHARTLLRPRAFATAAPTILAPVATDDVLSKYRNKLQERAEKEGFKSVEDLVRNGVKEKAKPKPATAATPNTQTTATSQTTQKSAINSAPSKPKSERNEGLPSFEKPLNDIVKIELLEAETPERIETIWNEHHATVAGMVSGVMPVSFYNALKAKGKECPLFVLPLPRETGVEFYFLQFAFNQIYFTSLLEYKTHLSEARPKLVLTHYDDLSESKGVVLMRGEVGREGGVLKADDARLLVLMTQMFYVTGSDAKKRMVEVFNKNPKEFQYQALMDEVEKLA